MYNRFPFIKIFVPFILGIAASGCMGIGLVASISITIAAFGIILCAPILSTYYQYKCQPYLGILCAIGVFFLGNILFICKNPYFLANHYSHFVHADTSYQISATILEKPVKKTKSYKTSLLINGIYDHQKWIPTQGKCFAYFTQTDTLPQDMLGRNILLQASFLPIKNNRNPGEFNFALYAYRKGILHQVFLKPSQYLLQNTSTQNMDIWFEKLKNQVLQIIQKNLPNSDNLGIANALLVGDRTDIDPETYMAYTKAGIVHIIAISGMHIGLIYTSILWVLSTLPITQKMPRTNIVLSILGLWLFAGITGMPPSVLRAAIMFSCIGIGKLLSARTNTYNTMLVSAFIILCINPYWIYDLGFQLSFAAVLGILLCSKTIASWGFTHHKYWNYIWNFTAVTLAAQLFTMPLCLYYFHQMPILFLFANLIAVPLTSLIIYIEILLIIFAKISFLAKYLGIIVSALITALQKFVFFISTYRIVAILNINITYLQMILLLLATIGIAYLFYYKSKKIVFATIILLLSFCGLHIYYKYQCLHQQKLLVYHTNKQSNIQLINGNTFQDIYQYNSDKNTEKYINLPAKILYKALHTNTTKATYQDSIFTAFTLAQKSFLVVKKPAIQITNPIHIDYCIITQNTNTDLVQLYQQLTPKYMIIDGSNSNYKIIEWKKQLALLPLQKYYTQDSGAFILDL